MVVVVGRWVGHSLHLKLKKKVIQVCYATCTWHGLNFHCFVYNACAHKDKLHTKKACLGHMKSVHISTALVFFSYGNTRLSDMLSDFPKAGGGWG